MGLFSSDKHKASDDQSKLPKKAKKIKEEKQKANRRQAKAIELRSAKQQNIKRKLW